MVHVTGGVEALAADEVRREAGATDVRQLAGKVCFSSGAPFATLLKLKSVESVSLLVWCCTTPEMPERLEDGASEADGKALEERWIARFAELLTEHALTSIGAIEESWRRDVGHGPGTVLTSGQVEPPKKARI